MMDPATARLALKMQLDDVQAILTSLPKASDAPQDINERAAFEALRCELVKKWNEVQGQVYAYSILKQENANRVAFRKLLDEEQQAERDHDMACRLAGLRVPQRPVASNKRAADQDDTNFQRTATDTKKLRIDPGGTQTAAPAPSVLSSKKRPAEDDLAPTQTTDTIDGSGTTSKKVKWDTGEKKSEKAPTLPPTIPGMKVGVCSSCLDVHPGSDMLQLPCKDDGDKDTHAYCRDCLRRLFECSVTDPSHFPPRCCSKLIPLFSCTPFLPQDLISRFVARREELGTPNRTYCSNTDCSKWIRPANIVANVATCSVCSQKTCTTCKNKQHEGLCPEDEDVKELMNFAQQKRWKTCPNCKEMVELERGCYHITCRCRHEFCYLCVQKWKTCKCPAWDERNIVDPRAGAINAVQPVANAAAAAAAAAAVAPAPAPIPRPPVPAQPARPVFPIVPAPQPTQPPQQNRAPAAQHNHSGSRGNRRTRKNRGGRNAHNFGPHVHSFERYYRSEGWSTRCHICAREDRWVNCCADCGLAVCWACTKFRA